MWIRPGSTYKTVDAMEVRMNPKKFVPLRKIQPQVFWSVLSILLPGLVLSASTLSAETKHSDERIEIQFGRGKEDREI